MANDGGDHHLGSRKDGSDLATARAVAKIANRPVNQLTNGENMKIVNAERIDEVSVVEIKHGAIAVGIQRVGDVITIHQSGRGNVRFAKSQAKILHRLLWG